MKTEMLFGSSFYRSFIRNAQKLTRTLYLFSLFLACGRAPPSCCGLKTETFLKALRKFIPLQDGCFYRGADKSLARPGRKQATATEEFEIHIAYL